MYLVLIYIIIVFTLIICHRQTVEGQNNNNEIDEDKDLEDLFREKYQIELTASDIRKKEIHVVIKHNIDDEINLKIFMNTKIEELKELLSKDDNIKIPLENMMLIHDDLILRDDKILLEYDIIDHDIIDLENSIKIISKDGKIDSKLYNILYDEDVYNRKIKDDHDPYERYLKEFLKYNKLKKVKSDKVYSQKISDLFKRKSKSLLKTYNQSQYLDDNLNEKMKEKGLDEYENDLVGPSPYIESPELFDRIIQDNNNNNNNNNDDKGKQICCDRTTLNIENPKLIDDKKMVPFKHDLLYESSIYGDFEQYNLLYYDYMETGNRIYNPLHGRMDNYKNPGELSL